MLASTAVLLSVLGEANNYILFPHQMKMVRTSARFRGALFVLVIVLSFHPFHRTTSIVCVCDICTSGNVGKSTAYKMC